MLHPSSSLALLAKTNPSTCYVKLLTDNGEVYGAHDSEFAKCADIVNGRQPCHACVRSI